jgi:hypothetical protein
MNPAPRSENDDVNDEPISPSAPRPKFDREPHPGARTSQEKLIDTDTNPDARPPGPKDQDLDAAGARKNIDQEPGGPTPVIGN